MECGKLEGASSSVRFTAGNDCCRQFPSSRQTCLNVCARFFLALQNFAFFGSEAISAIDRSVSFRLKRYPRGRTTICAIHLSSAVWIFSAALNSHQQTTIGATLWFIDQAFSAEKFLLSSRKNKYLIAVPAVQIFIIEFHKRLDTRLAT